MCHHLHRLLFLSVLGYSHEDSNDALWKSQPDRQRRFNVAYSFVSSANVGVTSSLNLTKFFFNVLNFGIWLRPFEARNACSSHL